MVRAVFFDFDHTLYSHTSKSIPQSAHKAIKALQSKGIICVLATGRHLVELRHFPEAFEVGLDGFVTIDGQLCLDRDARTICSNEITGKLKDDLLKLFDEKEYHVILIEEDRMYANIPRDSINFPSLSGIRHSVGTYTGNPLYMGVVYIERDKELWLSGRLSDCSLLRWGDPGVDVVPKGRSKVAGIEAFLRCSGLDGADYMAFGDGLNDMAMIKSAPIGIAMGNAVDEVKSVADYVTSSVDEDGVYNALVHYGLI